MSMRICGRVMGNNESNWSGLTIPSRCRKWWRRFFNHMMDVSMVNACILYNRNKDSRSKMTLLDFRIRVAEGLLSEYQGRLDRRHPAPRHNLPFRLTERGSFPEKIGKQTDYGGRPLCEVCKARGKRSQTSYRCKKCKTPLHCHPCMEIYYHTKRDYSK